MAFGEVGSIITSVTSREDYVTIELTRPLDDPVIVLSSTKNGDPFTLRVISTSVNSDGQTTSFKFSLEEWEYLDGVHAQNETVSWMALEAGTHTLPDGRMVEAGFAQANQTSKGGPNTDVAFNSTFDTAPVVLTTVVSNESPSTFQTVDSDPLLITTTGFQLRIQEEEGGDFIHPYEPVGWIAIEPGGTANTGIVQSVSGVDNNVDTISLGGTFSSGVVLVGTQTVNGADPATVNVSSQTNSTVGVVINEETSGDTEVAHVNETVGVFTFESGLVVCFTEGTMIETILGPERIENLSEGDLIKIHTENGEGLPEFAELKHIFRRSFDEASMSQNPKLYPVRIPKGALGGGLPERDLRVSQQHRMLVASPVVKSMFGKNEALVAAKQLTKLPKITVDNKINQVTYFHLLFDEHRVIYAEGAPSESLFMGEGALETLPPEVREEITTIFPETAIDRHEPKAARIIPPSAKQKELVQRHRKHLKPVLES